MKTHAERGKRNDDVDVAKRPAAAPGKVPATGLLGESPVQARGDMSGHGADHVHQAAAHGVSGGGQTLPHLDAIQKSFGPEADVSGISAHIGGPAAEACSDIGANAYATGKSVAFKQSPDLHTAAHEAAHVVQQRGGVWLSGGVGQAGDRYEMHADQVADRVVSGESAADLLAEVAPAGGGTDAVQAKAVQRDGGGDPDLDRARSMLSDRFPNPILVAPAIRGLLGRTDEEAVSVRNQLVERCRTERIFWNDPNVSAIQRAVDAHRNGRDNVVSPGPGFMATEQAYLTGYAEVAQDAALSQLAQDLDTLQDFYLLSPIYGENLPSYHGRIRTMLAFLAAGQPVDWQDYWDCDHWLEGEVFDRMLHPYVGNSVLSSSRAFGRYQDCYNDLQALRLQMEQRSPDNPYAATGRGMDKASLMSLSAEQPQYNAVSREQTQLDLERAITRGQELLQTRETVFPGDVHTARTQLRMLRDHSGGQQQQVDQLIGRLDELFTSIDDPEFARSTPSSAVEFDASQPFGLSALTSMLDVIANEPGESGNIKFKLSARAAIGTGLINGYVKGWAELALGYSVSDTLTCVLGFDVNAAIGAGLSLAGLVEAGGEVGSGFGMSARFGNPGEVATWIFGQMRAVNQRAGVRLFPLIGADDNLPEVTPTVLSNARIFGRGGVTADIGVAAAEGSAAIENERTGYSRDGESIGSGETTTTTYSAGALARMGPVTLRGGYTFTGTDVEGDVNASNNGNYHNHRVNVGFGLSREIVQNPVQGIPRQNVQDGVLNFFARLEGRMPGGIPQQALHGAFDGVVSQIYDACVYGQRNRSGIDVDVIFEWHNELLSSDEEYHMQYFRVSVTPTLSRGVGEVTRAGGVELEVSGSKTENVFEMLGTETWSYVYQQYKFQWTEEQWRAFVDANRSSMEELMTNMMTQGSPCYDVRFADLVRDAGGFEQRLQALEIFFDRVQL